MAVAPMPVVQGKVVGNAPSLADPECPVARLKFSRSMVVSRSFEWI